MVNIDYENRKLEAIGRRLLVARKSTDLNQGEFAKQAGLAQNTYNQYETGKRMPSIQNALHIADTYNLTLDWIYTGDPSGLSFQLAQNLKITKEAS